MIPVAETGYGSALMGGIAAARGRYVIMGDADDSYDFLEVPKFVAKLGVDVVIGGIVGRIAYSIMKKRGIKVFAGASGDAVIAVEEYIKGTLVTDESAIETRAPS